MSEYNKIKNVGLTTPTGNIDLGSDTNRYGNIFLQGNLAIGNLVANENTLVSPKISSVVYTGDDTAADPNGAQTITINGSGFVIGAAVYVGGSIVSSTAVISPNQITFVSPAKSPGNYTLLLVNTDGGTATFIPGIQYSGVPNWSTSAGSLANVYETESIFSTLSATSDSPITYAITSGSLPSGVTLTPSTGAIAGTAPSQPVGSNTYNFTASAIDGENQDTPRNFNIIVKSDVVTWASPADNTTYLLAQDNPISTISLSATSAAEKAITYTANSLPTGLSVSGSDIVGTPTVIANTSSILTATASGTGKLATRALNWVVAKATDLYFNYVTLLLTGDGSPDSKQNNTFLDSSPNNFSITRLGNVAQGTFTPFSQTGWSTYFPSESGIYFAPQTYFDFSTGSNTIEMWFYPSVASVDYNVLIANPYGVVNSLKWGLSVTAAGTINLYRNVSFISTNTVNWGQWNHIAVVTDISSSNTNATIRFYINGAASTLTGCDLSGWTNSGENIWFQDRGGDPYSSSYSCYMSNFRWVRDIVYSGTTLTVPIAPLTAIANTKLLTHSTSTFADTSTSKLSLTIGYGTPSIQAFSPFAPTTEYSATTHGGSGYFDGSGDYLTLASNAAFNLGTADFTLEFFIYPTSFSQIWISRQSSSSGWNNIQWYIATDTSGTVTMAVSNGGNAYNLFSTVVVQLNQWFHCAVVRNAGTWYFYLNGVSQGIAVGTAYGASMESNATGQPLNIGGFPGWGHTTGYLTDVRLVKGVAVYTGNFTPPIAPLSVSGALSASSYPSTANVNTSFASSATSLRTGFTNAGIIDSSSKNNLETVGNVQVNTGIKKYGTGSLLFDGTDDYILIPPTVNLEFGSADFTIEFWWYPTSTARQALYHGSFGTDWSIGIDYSSLSNNQKIGIWASSTGTSWNLVNADSGGNGFGTTTVTQNAWNHIAYVRNGTTWMLFVNGNRDLNLTGISGSIVNRSTSSKAIGTWFNTTALPEVSGYLDDFRITKGIARYTANFTAPTSKFLLK